MIIARVTQKSATIIMPTAAFTKYEIIYFYAATEQRRKCFLSIKAILYSVVLQCM